MAPVDTTTHGGNEPPGWHYTNSTASWCTSNVDSVSWTVTGGWANLSWLPAAPVLKLRHGKWQDDRQRFELDAKDSLAAVHQSSCRLVGQADRLTRRALDRKPRAVVMHQPAWSARRWKSLT